jgi:hypothetical protein
MTNQLHLSINYPANTSYVSTLPNDRPLMGKDIAQWRQTMSLSSADICWLLSLPSTKWGVMTKHAQDEFVHHEMELLIRIWDANHHLIPLPEKVSVTKLKDSLGVSPSDIGLLLGREEISGVRWIKNEEGDVHVGQTQTPLSQRLTLAVYRLSEANQRNQFFHLIKMVGQLRGIPDVLKLRTWKTPAEKRIGKIRRLVNSSFKMLNSGSNLTSQEKIKYLKIQNCSSSWVDLTNKLNALKPNIQNATNDSSRLFKMIAKKPEAQAAYQATTQKLELLQKEKILIETELKGLEDTLEIILGPDLDGKLQDPAKDVTFQKRVQKLLKLSPDNIVDQYAIWAAKEWLKLEECILNHKFDPATPIESRDRLDELNAQKKTVQQNLESILGPKLDHKPKKTSASERLTRQIHQIAKKTSVFAFTADHSNNVEITNYIKSQAAYWLDLSSKSNELQPELIILNDKDMEARISVDNNYRENVLNTSFELSNSIATVEDKLRSLLGQHLDTVRYRSPELLTNVRQINQWKSNSIAASKAISVISPLELKTHQFVIEQTSLWLKLLDAVEDISPLNLIAESNGHSALAQKEHDIIERMHFVYSTLQSIERIKQKSAEEVRFAKKIQRVKTNTIDFLRYAEDDNSLTSEIKIKEQTLSLCEQWFATQEHLDAIRPHIIIEEFINLSTNTDNDNDNLFTIESELSQTIRKCHLIESNLKSLLGNNLNGQVERSTDDAQELKKITRLITRAQKAVDSYASGDISKEDFELWTEVLFQANSWHDTFIALEFNTRHNAILRQNPSSSDVSKEIALLKEEDQALVTTKEQAEYHLRMILKSKFDPSFSDAEKVHNKIKRKVTSLVLSPERIAELELTPENSVKPLLVSNSAKEWLRLRDVIEMVQTRLAVYDSMKSRDCNFVNTVTPNDPQLELDTIVLLEELEADLVNNSELSFHAIEAESGNFKKAKRNLAKLQILKDRISSKASKLFDDAFFAASTKVMTDFAVNSETRETLMNQISAATSASELLSVRQTNNKILSQKLVQIETSMQTLLNLDEEFAETNKATAKLIRTIKKKIGGDLK